MARPGGISRDDQFVLAVDLGTGGPKVGLVSLTGAIACSEHLPVETRRGPGGAATQDADAWWQLIVASARKAVRGGPIHSEQIVAVSCTGQWASTVPVDADGLPVGDCLMWLDTRGGRLVRRAVGGPVGGYSPTAAARWVRRSGGAPSTSGADPIGHMLFLEHELPAVSSVACWYLEPVDYLSMRFTGVAAASSASMAGAWLTDNRRPAPLRYDPVLVRASGVPEHKLPPLRPTGSVVGTVLPVVADDLGLEPGVAVITGTTDLHSAATGAGAVLAYQPHLAISTTSWLSCPFPRKKTDPIRQMATVPVDNRAARAGFHNLSLQTTRSQLVRAVMEGVAFNSRWLCEGVERFVGRSFGPIRAIGGGATSPLWCSIYASVLDRPIEQVADPVHANLRGAALLAGMALGAVGAEEIESLVQVEATYRPDPRDRDIYDRLFAEFPALYSAQRGLFKRLNRKH